MIKLHKHENEAKEDSERKITNDGQWNQGEVTEVKRNHTPSWEKELRKGKCERENEGVVDGERVC